MNAKAALCVALLKGEVLNIKNCFSMLGLTNCPREISRMIEKPFGVIVSRTPKMGTTRYKTPCRWINYRLNNTDHNQEGMQKMREYVQANGGYVPPLKNPVGRPKNNHIHSINNTQQIF